MEPNIWGPNRAKVPPGGYPKRSKTLTEITGGQCVDPRYDGAGRKVVAGEKDRRTNHKRDRELAKLPARETPAMRRRRRARDIATLERYWAERDQ